MAFRNRIVRISQLIIDKLATASAPNARWEITSAGGLTNFIRGFTGSPNEFNPGQIYVTTQSNDGELNILAPQMVNNAGATARVLLLSDATGVDSSIYLDGTTVHARPQGGGSKAGADIHLEDTGWIEVLGGVGFQNGWTNFDARTVRYRRVNGVVYIEGIAKGGAIGSPIFTLPAGFRCSNRAFADKNLLILSNGAAATLLISGTGTVQCNGGSNVYVDLAGSPPFIADN